MVYKSKTLCLALCTILFFISSVHSQSRRKVTNYYTEGTLTAKKETDKVKSTGYVIYGDSSGQDFLDGNWKYYYKEGMLLETGGYIKGKKDGTWKTYHRNGKVSKIEIYNNGTEVGLWGFFNEEGKRTVPPEDYDLISGKRIFLTESSNTSDLDLAVSLLQKSAERGTKEAQFYLGYAYKEGRGVPRDIDKALSLFVKSCEQNEYESCIYIGNIYIDKAGLLTEEMSQNSTNFDKYDELKLKQIKLYQEALEHFEKAKNLNDWLDQRLEINTIKKVIHILTYQSQSLLVQKNLHMISI